jgi:hypothetical protein
MIDCAGERKDGAGERG